MSPQPHVSSLCVYRISPFLWGVILVFLLGMWTCGNAAEVFQRWGLGSPTVAALADDGGAPSSAKTPVMYDVQCALGSRGSMDSLVAVADRLPDPSVKYQHPPRTSFTPDAGLPFSPSGLPPSYTATCAPLSVRAAVGRLPAARGLVPFSIPPPTGIVG